MNCQPWNTSNTFNMWWHRKTECAQTALSIHSHCAFCVTELGELKAICFHCFRPRVLEKSVFKASAWAFKGRNEAQPSPRCFRCSLHQVKSGRRQPRMLLYGSCRAARFHVPGSSCLGNCGGRSLMRKCVPKLHILIPIISNWAAVKALQTSWNSGGLAYSPCSALSKAVGGLTSALSTFCLIYC